MRLTWQLHNFCVLLITCGVALQCAANRCCSQVIAQAPENDQVETAAVTVVSANQPALTAFSKGVNNSTAVGTIAHAPTLQWLRENDPAIGSILGVSQREFNPLSSSNLTLHLGDLPWNTTEATASCAFLPSDEVARLQLQAFQASGTNEPTLSRSVRSKYLDLASQSALSDASLVIEGTRGCTQSAESCPEGLYNFTAVCSLPRGSPPVVPAVLLQWPSDDDSTDSPRAWSIVGNGSWAHIQPARVVSLAPVLGPAIGNTSIVIKGQGFQQGIQCIFTDVSGQTSASATINATDITSDTLRCSTPKWLLENATCFETGIRLRWADGFQLPPTPFLFVRDPAISDVKADVLRYGGGNIVAAFGFSFAQLSRTPQATQLQPMLRLQQPGNGGQHVDLPARFSRDMSTLLAAVKPATRQQPSLSAGSWLVQASLNGGYDFCKDLNNSKSALLVSGPTVSMQTAHYQLSSETGSVTLYASLLGSRPSAAPVSVHVSIEQRLSSGAKPLAEGSLRLKTPVLRWAAGSNASQPILLSLPVGADFLDKAVLVTLGAATNADVSVAARWSIVSQAPQSDFELTFAAAVNQVQYPSDVAPIQIKIQPGRIPTPGAVRYTLRAATRAERPFLAGVGGVVDSVLPWEPLQGNITQLTVPVEWSQIPMEAVYRVNLTMRAAWNAKAVAGSRQPALHLFGVPPDTCPPGTFSKVAPTAPIATSTPGIKVTTEAFLRNLTLLHSDGSPIELSSQFQPNATLYGAMVPAGVDRAVLCVQPVQSGGQVAVFDPRQRLVPSLNDSSLFTFSEQAAADRLSRQSRRGGACSDSQGGYEVVLGLGQNLYEMYVTLLNTTPSADGSVQQAPNLATHYQAETAVQDMSNHTVKYSLAVVRRAVPDHARLATLNATTNAGGSVEVLPICGDSAAAAEAAANMAGASPGAPPPQGGLLTTGSNLMSSRATPIPCSPDSVMQLAVGFETTYLSLHPGLLFPETQGIRVEVNGQVLSQGGNLEADRTTDTTSLLQRRRDPVFLPPAIIMGLQPTIPLQVPLVIIAEDGVTSLRYYVAITRGASLQAAPQSSASVAKEALQVDHGSGAAVGAVRQSDSLFSSASSPLAGLLMDLNSAAGPADIAIAPQPESDSLTSKQGIQSFDDALRLSAEARALMQPLPPGWPSAPAQSPHCGACLGGWASSTANASYCTMCHPGTYAASAFATECIPCAKGTYEPSWGSTHCRHCVTGTFAPLQGGDLCRMCPANFTTEADGSSECNLPVGTGPDLSTRYAVIVSFGMLLNGTALEDIARLAGVNASSTSILKTLVRSDTASGFNVSMGNVRVLQVTEVSKEVLFVKLSAALPVDVPADASPDDVRAAYNVKSISADHPIQLLVTDPDKFFGRTAKALNVDVEGDGKGARRTLSRPSLRHRLALEWPTILGVVLGGVLMMGLTAAVFARRRLQRAYQGLTSGSGREVSAIPNRGMHRSIAR